MPKPPLLGEVASSEAKMSERLYRAAPALFRSLERRPLSNLSDACGASSPGRRALGKEVSFRSNTRCCDKTSPPQSLPLSGEVASSEAKMSERLYRAAPVLFRSLERRPLSNLSDACGASSPGRGGGIERSEDVGEVSSPQKQIPHTGRLRCGGAGMESENVFNRFCHRRQRCGSCHRRCRCTAPDRGRCAPRPPHRWGRGLQWQKPCSGSRCRPCR